MSSEAIYLRLPIALQGIACSLEGWRIQRSRYGTDFRNILRQIEERTYWSREQLLEYQNNQLRQMVRYCSQHVPYYRRMFRERSVPVERVDSVQDLSKYVPVLAKNDVKSQYKEFISEAIPLRKQITTHTSGTTGSGFHFAIVQETTLQQWAFWWRYRRWHGLDLGTWCGYFVGRSIVPMQQSKPPFWRINYPGRQIFFSAYHMSPSNLDSYLQELECRQVSWLHGYPSLLALLAAHALYRGVDLRSQVKWITIGAENLLPQQAELIKESFGIAPVQHYGQTEAVANISRCPAGNLHVDEDFSAVEFLPVGDGEICRIVGTGFINPATPLLRYDTQDLAVPEEDNTICSCGRHGRLVKCLDGRREDYVILTNGSHIGRMDHIFKDLVRIKEAQIYQREPGKVTFRIVRGEGYRNDDEQQLLAEARKRLGVDTHLEIDYVNELKRSQTGKLRFVISEIDEGKLESVGNH